MVDPIRFIFEPTPNPVLSVQIKPFITQAEAALG
jgi:hypothetical protein